MTNNENCQYRIKVVVEGRHKIFIPQVKRAWWWVFWQDLCGERKDPLLPGYRDPNWFNSDLEAYELILQDLHYSKEEEDYEYYITDFADLIQKKAEISAAEKRLKERKGTKFLH